jgi:probable HAF family extracellular repeat protein
MAATYTIAKGSTPTTTGADNDIIEGGDFKTNINAGNGINIVRTGKENDVIATGNDNDFIDAGDGRNTINAGNGKNRVLAGKGNDNIAVGSGDNLVYSGAGDDTISALFGNSIINAGTGNDEVDLGGGNNRVVLEGGSGDVTITGFDIAKDKLRLGESLLGKSLTFTTNGEDTLVKDGTDLVATLKGVKGGSATLIDNGNLYKYESTELGSFNTINKNANVVAAAINDVGQIAGRYDTAGTFINENATTNVLQTNNVIRQGFIWDKGKLTALTNVGVKKGSSEFGAANGETVNVLVPVVRNLNNRGLAIGTVDEVRQPIPVATDRALAWEPNATGGYNKLTINDFGGQESYFFDANNSNQLAGRNVLVNGFEKPLFFDNGVVTELAQLGGDGGTTQGINNKGQIVGYVDSDGKLDEKFTNTAVIWEKDAKGAYQLKNLGTFGAAQATLKDINDAGDMIGAKNNGLTGADATSNPFIIRDGKFTDLGSLGGKTGSVTGINSFGTVVGASQFTDGKTNHAFVWSNGKLSDLNSLVSKPITYEGAAVVLTSAVSINNFGDIAATGTFTYKDATTGLDTTGTRAYELKGIANSIAAAAPASTTVASPTITTPAALTAPTVIAAPALTTPTTVTAPAAVSTPTMIAAPAAITTSNPFATTSLTTTTPAPALAPAQVAKAMASSPVSDITNTNSALTAAPIGQEMLKMAGTSNSLKSTEPVNIRQLLFGGGIGDESNRSQIDTIIGRIESLHTDLRQYQQFSGAKTTA